MTRRSRSWAVTSRPPVRLMASLSDSQRTLAIGHPEAISDIVTGNRPLVTARATR